MGSEFGWTDKVLGEIGAKKDNYTLIREAQLLRNRIKELQQVMEKLSVA